MEKTVNQKFKSVQEYFSSLPPGTKRNLNELRKAVKEVAPKAKEVISYNMPALKLHGILVWYAGYKKHIGFYPTPGPIEVFKEELSGYKTSKGAIQFPLGKKIPIGLVRKIVKFRVTEDETKERMKAKKKE